MPAEECTTGNPMDAPARLLPSRGYGRNDFSFSTPSRIAYEGGKLRLRHYAPTEPARSTPILFVYALTKRAFILDLAPGRSVVQSLAQQGFHVYLTDWIPPASSDSSRGLGAYVNEDLLNAVHVIAAERGTSQVSIIGYCLGALLGVIYTALHPRHVRNLVALTVPLEMSATATLVPAWLSAQTVELITALYGNCPAWVFSALSSARLMTRMAQFRAEICGREERSEVFDRFLRLTATFRWRASSSARLPSKSLGKTGSCAASSRSAASRSTSGASSVRCSMCSRVLTSLCLRAPASR